MAQGENAEKRGHPGKEYWTKRYPYPLVPGKYSKFRTHKVERGCIRRLIHNFIIDED